MKDVHWSDAEIERLWDELALGATDDQSPSGDGVLDTEASLLIRNETLACRRCGDAANQVKSERARSLTRRPIDAPPAAPTSLSIGKWMPAQRREFFASSAWSSRSN